MNYIVASIICAGLAKPIGNLGRCLRPPLVRGPPSSNNIVYNIVFSFEKKKKKKKKKILKK